MSMSITFIGHATVLVDTGSVSFLTDPVLSQRVLWLKRRTPLPFPPEKLADPAAIFISHAHYDHLDIPSFKYFSSKVPVILPKGLGALVSRFANNPLIELTAGSSHEIRPGLRVTAVPVTHDSFRLSGLTYRGCLGYWIDSEGKKIFFPGDTAYRSDFKNFRRPDVALLPIGPCRPEWFMRKRHLCPEDVVRLVGEMEPEVTVPIHWGTFRLGFDGADEPMNRLKNLIEINKPSARWALLRPGESFSLL